MIDVSAFLLVTLHIRPALVDVACIYGLADPKEPTRVRYVGSTQNLGKRLRSHAASSPRRRYQLDGPKVFWLAEMRAQGRRPIAYILEFTSASAASPELHAQERRWIARFRAEKCADLNQVLRTNKQISACTTCTIPAPRCTRGAGADEILLKSAPHRTASL